MNTSRTLSVQFIIARKIFCWCICRSVWLHTNMCSYSSRLLTSLLPERNAKIVYAYRTRYPSLSMPYWPYFSTLLLWLGPRKQFIYQFFHLQLLLSTVHVKLSLKVYEKNCQVIVESHLTLHKHCLEQIKSVNSTKFLGLICLISLPTSYDYQLKLTISHHNVHSVYLHQGSATLPQLARHTWITPWGCIKK